MSRLFIGIRCSQQLFLADLQAEMKQILARSRITWVDPANFHITLKFLGDVEEIYNNSIMILLDSIAKEHNSAVLFPHALGTFGPKYQPRVIWFGYNENQVLTSLQTAIDDRLAELGFAAEPKVFTPHLTLGRVKEIVEKKEFENYLNLRIRFDTSKFVVNSFQLMKSVLKKEGPEYHTLGEFHLGNRGS
jgi:RNA 2',3'-cyclic 3'-phosphodiesterase